MGEQERRRGVSDESDVATGVDPDHGPKRGRVIAVVAGAIVILMLAGVVVAVRDDGSRPGLAKLPLVENASAAGSQQLAADAAMLPATTISFELEGELPALPATGPVSRFRLPALDDSSVRDLARGLGVDDPATVRREGEGWFASGEQRELSAYPFGRAWSVGVNPRVENLPQSSPPSEGSVRSSAPSDEIATTTPVEPPANLPSAAEAERIAREQLAAAGVVDPSWTAEVLDGGTVSIAVACTPDAQCPEPAPSIVTARSVLFTKVVDGSPVAGLTWSAEVGDRGEISNLYGTLTELDPLGEYPLRTTQDTYVALTEQPHGDGEMPLGAAESRGAVDLGPADAPSTTPEAVAPGTDAAGTPAVDPDSPVESPPLGGAPDEQPVPVEPVEEIVVTITGVERATMLSTGLVDGEDVTFVVPAYRFVGRYADGSAFETIVSALDPSMIEPPPR